MGGDISPNICWILDFGEKEAIRNKQPDILIKHFCNWMALLNPIPHMGKSNARGLES